MSTVYTGQNMGINILSECVVSCGFHTDYKLVNNNNK